MGEYAEESVGRTPPQDFQTEQDILEATLMSKDAISDMVGVLRSSDFYQPKHGSIFESIISPCGRGEPTDPITIIAELGRTGDLRCIDEAVYLYDLPTTISIAASASYYAKVVREKVILRCLVNTLVRIA